MVCKTCPDLFCAGCIVSLHENQVCLLAWREEFHFRGYFWKPIGSKNILHLGLESLEMLLLTLAGLFFHQWFISWFWLNFVYKLPVTYFLFPSLLESKKCRILGRKSLSPCLHLYRDVFLNLGLYSCWLDLAPKLPVILASHHSLVS